MTASYAPPTADLAPRTDADVVRERFIGHEREVRSVGSLYLLGAGLIGLMGFLMLAATAVDPRVGAEIFGMMLVYLAIATLNGWVGLGLRRLDPRVRGAAGLMSGFGLLFFPVGTLIHGWILYLIFCQKGTKVFSEEYREVIAATPHVRPPGTSLVAVLLGLLLLGGLVVAVMLSLE